MASALVAVRSMRTRRNNEERAKDVGDCGVIVKMPPPKDVLEDVKVSRRVISALAVWWPERRMVFTADQVYFSSTFDEISVIDTIPVLEIEKVQQLRRQARTPLARATSQQLAVFESSKSRLSLAQTSWKSEIELGCSSDPIIRCSSINSDRPEDYDEDHNPEHILVIHTNKDGPCVGRQSVILLRSKTERDAVASKLEKIMKRAHDLQDALLHPGRRALVRRNCFALYNSNVVQGFTISVIVLSFITTCYESQRRPADNSLESRIIFVLEVIYTCTFALELIFNFCGNFFLPFFRDWPNWFDLCVVAISIAGLVQRDLPAVAVLRLVRLVRVLRVLRLVRFLAPLRLLTTALYNSVEPVIYSFILLGLVTTIFAVIATDMFADMNPEKFGDLESSVFTLFQVSTGDAWASDITRGVVEQSPEHGAWVHLFFVGFFLMVGIVLMNIVIAVLLGPPSLPQLPPLNPRTWSVSLIHQKTSVPALISVCLYVCAGICVRPDEFLTTVSNEKEERRKKHEAHLSEMRVDHSLDKKWPLDPLIVGLATFTSHDDLRTKIAKVMSYTHMCGNLISRQKLCLSRRTTRHASTYLSIHPSMHTQVYERFDIDESGSLSLEELNRGLGLLSLGQKVQLSAEDFEALTMHGQFLNVNRELGPKGFEDMIVSQLRLYTNRKVVSILNRLDFKEWDSQDAVRVGAGCVGVSLSLCLSPSVSLSLSLSFSLSVSLSHFLALSVSLFLALSCSLLRSLFLICSHSCFLSL